MPYVITTSSEYETDAEYRGRVNLAVATLDEAREAVRGILVEKLMGVPTGLLAEELTEKATFEALSDGTVIEVERVRLNDLRIGTGTLEMTPAEVIATYNGRAD